MTESNSELTNALEILKLPVENFVVSIWIAEVIAGWSRSAGGLGPIGGADGTGVGVWIGEEDCLC